MELSTTRESIRGQPLESPSVGQPLESPSVVQPLESPSVGQPLESPSVGQPLESPSVGQPLESPSVGQPHESPSVGQPLESPTVGSHSRAHPLCSHSRVHPWAATRESIRGQPLESPSVGSHSRTYQHFMEPEGSLLTSQARPPPFSWARSIQPIPHPISLTSILILSTHPRLGLPSGLFPSGLPTSNLYEFFYSPVVLHALSITSSLNSSL
jgi:hypothetical protein